MDGSLIFFKIDSFGIAKTKQNLGIALVTFKFYAP